MHPNEMLTFETRFPDWATSVLAPASHPNRAQEWLGGRFAAKEAAKKAWGASLVGFKDLRVKVDPSGGRLEIICTPFVVSSPTFPHDAQAAALTVAHDGEYAIATVMATPLHETIIAELGRRKAEAESKVTHSGAKHVEVDAIYEERQHLESDEPVEKIS